MAKGQKFGQAGDFDKHIGQPATEVHNTGELFFPKREFVIFSKGEEDKGKPVKLNFEGVLDRSVAGFEFSSYFEFDGSGDLQPIKGNMAVDLFFELDENNDIQPREDIFELDGNGDIEPI